MKIISKSVNISICLSCLLCLFVFIYLSFTLSFSLSPANSPTKSYSRGQRDNTGVKTLDLHADDFDSIPHRVSWALVGVISEHKARMEPTNSKYLIQYFQLYVSSSMKYNKILTHHSHSLFISLKDQRFPRHQLFFILFLCPTFCWHCSPSLPVAHLSVLLLSKSCHQGRPEVGNGYFSSAPLESARGLRSLLGFS